MAEKTFRDFQEQECELPEGLPFPIICPTCIPNPNFIEPIWYEYDGGTAGASEAYLNEKTCEYQVAVTINEEGVALRNSDLTSTLPLLDGDVKEDYKGMTLRQAAQTYIRSGIYELLEQYDKLISTETVCALERKGGQSSLPALESPGSPLRPGCDYDIDFIQEYSIVIQTFLQVIEGYGLGATGNALTVHNIPNNFDWKAEYADKLSEEDIEKLETVIGGTLSAAELALLQEAVKDAKVNPYALEWTAYVKDIWVDKGSPIKVLIAVPAYNFDIIPDAPGEEESGEGIDEVILDPYLFVMQLQRLRFSLWAFNKYMSFHEKHQDGKITFKDTIRPYDMDIVRENLSKFSSGLQELLVANDFKLPAVSWGPASFFRGWTARPTDSIKIKFNNTNPNKFYKIKSVWARPQGCKKYQKLKRSFRKFKSSLGYIPTTMGYVAQIEQIDEDLRAREPAPWIEFIQSYTYPQLSVHYGDNPGDVESVEDAISCVIENVIGLGNGNLKNYLLDETLNMLEVFAYLANQNICRNFGNAGDYDPGNKRIRDQYALEEDAYEEELQRLINEQRKVHLDVADAMVAQQTGYAWDLKVATDFWYMNMIQAYVTGIGYSDATGMDLQELRDADLSLLEARQQYQQSLEDSAENISTISDEAMVDYASSWMDEDLNPTYESEADIPQTMKDEVRQKAEEKAKTEVGEPPLSEEEFERWSDYDEELDANINTLTPDLKKQAKKLARRKRIEGAKNFRERIKKHPYYSVAQEAALHKYNPNEDVTKLVCNPYGTSFNLPVISGVRDLLHLLGICGMSKFLEAAIRCLMGGMDFNTAMKQLIRSAFKAMSYGQIQKVFVGLPVDKQIELKEKIANKFGELPLPWETRSSDARVGPIVDAQSQYERSSGTGTFGGGARGGRQDARSANTSNRQAERTSSGGVQRRDEDARAEQQAQAQAQIDAWDTEKAAWEAANLPPQSDDAARSFEEHMDYRVEATYRDEEAVKTISEGYKDMAGFILNAYIEEMLDSVSLEILMERVGRIPGAKLVPLALQLFKCPNKPLFSPTPAEFLKGITLDVCDITRPITWPKLPRPARPWWNHILKSIKEAFIDALINMVIRLLTALILKICQIINTLICKSLQAIGTAAANALTPGDQGGLWGAFSDTFCGPEAAPGTGQQLTEGLFDALGIQPDSTATADLGSASGVPPAEQLAQTISNIMSKKEIIGELTVTRGERDTGLLSRVSNAVSTLVPAYADFFDTPAKVGSFFEAVGNFIPPDQRDDIRNALLEDTPDLPLHDTICLTNRELDEWNKLREVELWEDGLPPADAYDVITNMNETTESIFEDFCDIQFNGIEGLIEDAVMEAINPAPAETADGVPLPPGCEEQKGILPQQPQEARSAMDSQAGKMFDYLAAMYTKDLVGKNGFLDLVLADTEGRGYKRHGWKRRNIFTRWFYFDSEEQEEELDSEKSFWADFGPEGRGFYPETVATHIRDSIIAAEPPFQTSNISTTAPVTPGLTASNDPAWSEEIHIRYRAEDYRRKETDMIFEYRDGGIIRQEQNEAAEGVPWLRKVPSYDYGFDMEYCNNLHEENSFDYRILIRERFQSSDEDGEDKNAIDYVLFNYVIQKPISAELASLIQEIRIIKPLGSLGDNMTYKPYIFNLFVNSKLNQFQGYNKLDESKIYDKIFTNFFKKTKDLLITKPGYSAADTSVEALPEACIFGYDFEKERLTQEDFLYVDPAPGSEDYTKDEEERILGRSYTDSSRVHYMDPAVYGGRYSNPPLYISPPEHDGWLGIARSLVPELDACSPIRTDLADFNSIVERVNHVRNSVATDERLMEDYVCVSEPPFGRILSKAGHGMMDGIIRATIRIYYIQEYLAALPVFSNVEPRMGINYDSGFSEYVALKMMDGLKNTGRGLRWAKIKDNVYWLLFLEQTVQAFQRMYELGEIELDTVTSGAVKSIGDCQGKYKYPRSTSVVANDGVLQWLRDNPEFNLPNRMLTIDDLNNTTFNQYALAYGIYGDDIFYSNDRVKLNWTMLRGFKTLEKLRLASKLLAIRIVQDDAIELMKIVIEKESRVMIDRFALSIEKPAPIWDLHQYVLGDSGIFHNSSFIAGQRDYMEELSMNPAANPGDVANVVKDVELESVLEGASVGDIADTGKFILEKYIRIFDKETGSTIPGEDAVLADPAFSWLISRDPSLKGVVNIESFKEFLDDNIANIEQMDSSSEAANPNISDVFGDMQFIYGTSLKDLIRNGISKEDLISLIGEFEFPPWGYTINTALVTRSTEDIAALPERIIEIPQEFIKDWTEEEKEALGVPIGVNGSIGLKYGLRMAMVMPSDFNSNIAGIQKDMDLAKAEKTYFVKPLFDEESEEGADYTGVVVPIVEVEYELLDVSLKEFDPFDTQNENKFDLLCLVNKLLATPEYELFFDHLFPNTTFASMLATYSALGFVSSLGQGEGERVKGEDDTEDGNFEEWSRETFKHSKDAALDLFRGAYDSREFNSDEAKSNRSLKELIKQLSPFTSQAPRFLSWWKRKKLIDRPFNKDGGECPNVFADLFKKG